MLLGSHLLGSVSALLIAGRSNALPCGTRALLEIPPIVSGPKLVLHQVWDAVRFFLRKAGTVILLASVVLWAPARAGSDPTAGPAAVPGDSRYQFKDSARREIGWAVEPGIRTAGLQLEINVGLSPHCLRGRCSCPPWVRLPQPRATIRDPWPPNCRLSTYPCTPVFTPGTVAALLVLSCFCAAMYVDSGG